MKRTLLISLGSVLLYGVVTCGGTAVVDGGAGGSTGTTTSSGSVVCNTPDPVGSLVECSTVGVTTGGASQCIATLCDDDGNTWESACDDGEGCVCRFNGTVRCSCSAPGAEICSGADEACCPAPFPK